MIDEAASPTQDEPAPRKPWAERFCDWVVTPKGMTAATLVVLSVAGGKEAYRHHQLAGHEPMDPAYEYSDRLAAAQQFSDMMKLPKYKEALYNFVFNEHKIRPVDLPVTPFEREVYSNLLELTRVIEQSGVAQFESHMTIDGKNVRLVHNTLDLQNYLGRNNPDKFKSATPAPQR